MPHRCMTDVQKTSGQSRSERRASEAAEGPNSKPKPKRTPRATGFKAWLTHRHDPLTSLLLTIPVFLTYHLGILLIDMRNGVDLVSGLTFRLLQHSLLAYIGVTLGYAVAIGLAVWVMRRRGTIKAAELLPVLGESVVLALLMSVTVGWATARLVGAQTGPPPMGPLEKLVMAAGAGFHEEIVFRVLIFSGGTWLLKRAMKESSELKPALAMALLSSLVFSAIHYVGPYGDPFALGSFVFRALAGLYLVGVYRWRGFAVAVYTHMIYDLVVFFLR
ncbi:MAG TPA: CPBP family intramembrane metalloprotease [Polyangiaceae bacterium]|nr:CPBP family intramembrane metalloprotease [Polyangiaceae bacterium]